MRRFLVIVAGTIALLVVTGTAAPATTPAELTPQSVATKIVQGVGDVTDDLSDEATLCNGCPYWRSNYAGFWQIILWSEGYLAANQVDCEFGPITARATESLQSVLHLNGIDGIVGPETRGRVDNRFEPEAGLFHYHGRFATVDLLRVTADSGNYWVWWSGRWSLMTYNTVTIPGC